MLSALEWPQNDGDVGSAPDAIPSGGVKPKAGAAGRGNDLSGMVLSAPPTLSQHFLLSSTSYYLSFTKQSNMVILFEVVYFGRTGLISP